MMVVELVGRPRWFARWHWAGPMAYIWASHAVALSVFQPSLMSNAGANAGILFQALERPKVNALGGFNRRQLQLASCPLPLFKAVKVLADYLIRLEINFLISKFSIGCAGLAG